MKQSRTHSYLILTLIVSVSFIFSPVTARADVRTDLEAKKRALEGTIKQNQEQKKSEELALKAVKREIEDVNKRIDATRSTIERLRRDIDAETGAINVLSTQIEKQQSKIKQEQENLEVSLGHMYIDTENSSPVLSLMRGESLSTSVEVMQGYEAVENAVMARAQAIATIKAELTKQQHHRLDARLRLEELQKSTHDQEQALNATLSLKNDLQQTHIKSVSVLNDTIAKHQSELRVVDGDIDEFVAALNAIGAYNLASGDLVISNTSPWYYSQRDSRWASVSLSPDAPESTFRKYGCLISAMAMALSRYGSISTPPQLLAQLQSSGAMYGDEVIISKVNINNTLHFTRQVIDWDIVKTKVVRGEPVIVRLNLHSNNYPYHWVVIRGITSDSKFIIDDPFFTATERAGYPASMVDIMAVPSVN